MTGIRTTINPNSPDNFSFCGGVLITPTHVLTTASCTTVAKANYVSVGAHYINGNNDGDEIKVKNITNHPRYNPATLANDFAVLTLAKRSKFTPIGLPKPGSLGIQSGAWAMAMGWGLTSADGMASLELLQVGQQVITNEACRTALTSSTIGPSHVCAGGVEGKSPCQGDTGGPLIRTNSVKDSDDVLIGLISGGGTNGCGTKGFPTIYARVSSAVAWINSVTKAK
ncbi:unnamed protein product [Peronospora belbahrii]|uniref:Peptidase S1 domain-containing protein n=1 Tax=Peronospora belbahrii TaxID=622444 RepID=A0AAU9KS45_9STRA|nr:unnamed protein product [Peronospora belbahrii]CAH0521606.1 unnamed protein product [Peronospora belbahrii]